MAEQQDAKWGVKEMQSTEKPWSEKTGGEKAWTVFVVFLKVVSVLALLYLFIISLGLMGNAFKVLGGKTAGATFRNNEIFSNPFAGLVMGILATVLVQSSSTSTSIIITMTAAGLLKVDNAIPMIMGANIGTSVTNTIVSLAHFSNKDEYRRAFAGATVHDCFNILTVSLLLPIEAITHVLRHMAEAVADATLEEDQEKAQKQDFLKKITKPISARLIQVDKKLTTKIAQAATEEELEKLNKKSMIKRSGADGVHIFLDTPLSDDGAGWLLLIVSLVLLTVCLALLVKLLQSIFRGRAAIWMQALLNLEFKSVPFVGDYLLLLFGIGITILMQSSSITTSTLTPLVGVGLISIDKMFPFTVGANIGTTITGILSALASSNIKVGMTVALTHLFFNLLGFLIWFPILPMRRVPLSMAKVLGSLAADLSWFPLAYIFTAFVLVPVVLLGLSLAGAAVFGVFGALLLLLFLALVAVCYLRRNRPQTLPAALQRDPKFMPASLRVERPAEDAGEEQAGEEAANADMGAATRWDLAPVAWGGVWLAILLLLLGVPNAQWSCISFADFDPRGHVGIGAWSACSDQFEEAMSFAPAPSCTPTEASTCWAWTMASCGTAGFSDDAGANEAYESSWENCTAHFQCTAAQWEAACLSANCGGSSHSDQCKNLTAAVSHPGVVLSYPGSGTAWEAGERCRPVEQFCDNHGMIGHAGNLAVASIVFALLGMALLLAYQGLRSMKDVSKALAASAAAFALTWVLLLASWAAFAGAANGKTTCTVVDATTRKAAVATGTFSDITRNTGSFSYGFVIGAWVLLTLTLPVIVHRVICDLKKPPEAKADETAESSSVRV